MTNVNDTASAALAYIQAGWAVVPLHDVAGGICSCASADEPAHSTTQGGKHPLWSGWQNAGIRDAARAAQVWSTRPQANIGIVTGRASGLWVLDVDPEHGGDQHLAALVAAYGPLPETFTVQTGSGGRHYYWAMPDFDFTTSRGQLPVGLDVRGNRGQVVAPPSYTLKGSYRVLVAAPVTAAPGWLLSMIRPVQRAADPASGWNGDGGREWEALTTPPPGGAGRGEDYAMAAVRSLLAELASALPGSRNSTAYRVARRLAELVNSPWAALDGQSVAGWFMQAALACDIDGGFSQTEAEQTLRKAIWHQRGVGAALPAADFYGSVWTPPVFPPGAPESGISDPGNSDAGNIDPSTNGHRPGGGTASDFDQAGQGPADPFSRPVLPDEVTPVHGQLINGYPEQPQQPDPWERAVLGELSRLLVREEATRRLRNRQDAARPIQILDREAQLAMPRIRPLIAGWLGQGQACRVFGPPGAGKTFAAVEWAACVSTGTAWHGRPVVAGEVVYFAVEDPAGVALRLQAWEREHQTEHRVHLVQTPLQMNVDTVQRVLGAVETYFGHSRLGLIVLDTQAMVTVGMDENSAGDMGHFVEAVKLLAARTGATVLTVHHSGVRGGRARGSTSVLGAMDVEIESSLSGGTVTLTCVKQKNVAPPPPLLAALKVVDMGERDEMGAAVTSCVLVAAGDEQVGPFTMPAAPPMPSLHRRALAIAAVLVETAASGETYSRVRTRAAEVTSFGTTPAGIASAFSRAWAYLVGHGRIAKAQGREAYYFIDVDGLDRLAANPGKMVEGGPEVYVPGPAGILPDDSDE